MLCAVATAAFAVLGFGCSSQRTISVLSAPSAPHSPRANTLEIDVNASSVHLPLSVAGSSVAYRDVDRVIETSLTKALEQEPAPLSERHAKDLALLVELIDTRAEYAHERLVVELGVRATLRERAGNVHVAQTHAHCASSGSVPPERGASTVLECADVIGARLAGWLAGVDTH